MKDREFNLYMKKFDNRYFVQIDEDDIRTINGRFGQIAPYDPEKQLLGVWCTNITPRRKKSILIRLSHLLIEVHQDCDGEFGAYFHENDLEYICRVIKARRKRELTAQQKQALMACARINFKISAQRFSSDQKKNREKLNYE